MGFNSVHYFKSEIDMDRSEVVIYLFENYLQNSLKIEIRINVFVSELFTDVFY